MITNKILDPIVSIQVDTMLFNFPLKIEKLVDKIWDSAVKQNPTSLRDDLILIFCGYEKGVIKARLCNYRFYYAQHQIPELYSSLGLNSLAVSGVITCKNGVVIGKRGFEMLQDAGMLELVPSGAVDYYHFNNNNKNVESQIISELEEEIGLIKSYLSTVKIVSMVTNPKLHVVDLVFDLRTELSAREIKNRWRDKGSREYSEIYIFPKLLLKFLSIVFKKNFSGTSREIIKYVNF
jgi:hypothetical protein